MFFYNIGIRLYALLLWCAAPFHPKAKKWLLGRHHWQQKIAPYKGKENLIWFHAASTGEMEMALPILQEWKSRHPQDFIFLSIFSPSAEPFIQRNQGIDAWMYLPLDTASHAEYWVHSLKPKAAVFIKYDFWVHYLRALQKHGVPTFFSGSIFRPDQIFFKKYGAFYARELQRISFIFVQNEESIRLLNQIAYTRTQIVGDTRFDRVQSLVNTPYTDAKLEDFLQGKPCIIVGSSWPSEEKHYLPIIEKWKQYSWIIAPHEIHESRIEELLRKLPAGSQRYTRYKLGDERPQVMVLDTLGMLAKVYRYAHIALVGGAFGPGVHSLLEPSGYGLPTLFGPVHGSFKEASELINHSCGFCYHNSEELNEYIEALQHPNKLEEIKKSLQAYFKKNAQVHQKVVSLIEQAIEK